jgi:hypothetical protein
MITPEDIYPVLICGAREWGDIRPIRREIKKLIKKVGTERLVIIEGKAPGADTLAGVAARDLNVHVAEIGALWDTRRKGAGPQRNAVMLAFQPEEVIAFHKDISKSVGTKNCISQARRLGSSYITVWDS